MSSTALSIVAMVALFVIGTIVWMPPYCRRFMVRSNIPDRNYRVLVDDKQLLKWDPVARGRKPISSFRTSKGKCFNIYIIDDDRNRDKDRKIANLGYTHTRMYGAREDSSGRIFAIWEFYHKNGLYFRSKAIDVDDRFQRQGIGSGLLDAVMLYHNGDITLSGKYSLAGATLLRKYAIGWKPRWLDNRIRLRRHNARQ
ncbi:hypothetical protein GA0061102_107711 [Rhizobium miluonense]|uniref:Uncharacterized protein n=1 Tax=Rhizobium miluonense TaxID=411945 RepID=A0A1C3XBQ1_9HYPH|nr:hypothetical protein GA0061102_107711 [Rhizobium miluonense]